MSEELRPCPFCGTPNEVYSSDLGIVYCDKTSRHPHVSVFTDLWQNAYCWKRIAELEAENSNVRTILAYERDKFGKLETDLKKSHAEIVAGLTLANNERWETILELQRRVAEKSDSTRDGN